MRSVFFEFLRLGLVSFGGPIAHLGYFREAFVKQRKWLDEETYADLVGLCQMLPGPASSQVAMGIGLLRGGRPGVVAAWLGFTLPSAAIMILLAYGVSFYGHILSTGWIRGLKIAAVAVVAQATLGMARRLSPDLSRASLTLLATAIVLLWPTAGGQFVAIVVGAVAGSTLLSVRGGQRTPRLEREQPRLPAIAAPIIFVALLLGLPVIARSIDWPSLAVVDSFYRSGALVFGGGHVVLPLLEAEVVPRGWIDLDRFLAGYGAAQALPGPLFSFAAYLGAAIEAAPGGWRGGLLALGAIYLPSMLLVVGVWPMWRGLRERRWAQSGLAGVNAAVVGLLAAALYHPVSTAAVRGPADLVLAIGTFLLLTRLRLPTWAAVLGCAGVGALLGKT